jgi:tetratricopeptide (TPR) repeat protein
MKGLIFFISLFLLFNSVYAEEKIEELEKKLKEDPKNVSIIHQLAHIYHHKALYYKEKGALKKAERFFQKTHKAFPKDVVILAWYGSLLTIKARDTWFPLMKLYYLRRGISMLDKAVKSAEDNIAVRMVRANNSLNLPAFTKRLNIAIKDFKYLLRINKIKELPKELLGKIHLGLVKVYIKKDNKEEAKRHLKEVFKFADKASPEYKEAISIKDRLKYF